ncbi:MAG: hypothetical protein GYA66_02420 [Phyllobacteriaceae bacterium]|nr:hypothetical protein [Phyllobacteriaceae bacterium]
MPELPVGIYHCYFTLQNVPGMLLRSLLLIRTTGKLKTFVRVSKFRSVDGRQKSLIRSFHTGVVVANSTEIYLLGVNRYPPYQFS